MAKNANVHPLYQLLYFFIPNEYNLVKEEMSMSLLLDLQAQYQPNQPIFLEDIKSDKYSYDTIKSMLSNYVKTGKMRRFSSGIYFFTQRTHFGESACSIDEVLEKKYIKKENEVFGYYTGRTLLNLIGLSTQVPNTIEIATNIETNKKRKTHIAGFPVILRKPLSKVSSATYPYLQFLDIFRYADIETIRKHREQIISFIHEHNLKQSVLVHLVISYPTKPTTIMLEEGFYDELA